MPENFPAMTQPIEDTIRALTEFESALDQVKADTSESKRKLVKGAGDWAVAAKAGAIAKAQQLSAERVAKARVEAESEAEGIRRKGQVGVKNFAETISKGKKDAIVAVVGALLGETS